jgi:hypothetical protein
MSPETSLYQIQIKGHLDERWALRFEGLTIHRTFNAQEEPITLITGPIVDQAALYGTLSRLRDLGVTLISVQQIDEHQEE